MPSYDFDPLLPDLGLAFDLPAVGRLFEERWPAHGGDGRAPGAVTSCKLQDTKYQPGARCVTVYELTLDRPGDAPLRTIGALEITPQGAQHRLFDDDARLPTLRTALDPQQIQPHIAGLWHGPGEAGPVAVTPVRYKPGARCVIRYQLPAPGGAPLYFGKLLAKGGEQLMETIAALHQASEANPELPRIPPPLAYWPELHLLIQPAVPGSELNASAFDPAEDRDTRERWIAQAGARLAALHGLTTVAGPPRTFHDDMDELREYSAPIRQVHPPLADSYEQTLAAIEELAATLDEPHPVASHGAFRTDQFLIEDGRLVMIDLDGFCWSNPARDIGNFLAYLDWKLIRQPHNAPFIEDAARAFMAGYAQLRAPPDARWLAVYRADSLLKILGRRYRSLTVKEWPLIPRLLEAAQGALRLTA